MKRAAYAPRTCLDNKCNKWARREDLFVENDKMPRASHNVNPAVILQVAFMSLWIDT